MLIAVRLDPGATRRWHVHLLDQVAALPGVAISLVPASAAQPCPRGLGLLLAVERLIGGTPPDGASDAADYETLPYPSGRGNQPDLVIDLVGAGSPVDGATPVLRLLCDGAAFERGSVDAVLAGREPLLEVVLLADGASRLLAHGWPAIEVPHRFSLALDMLAGTAAAMLFAAVRRLVQGDHPSIAASERPDSSPRGGSALGFFTRSLEQRIARRLDRLLGKAPDWHVALRRRRGDDGIPNLDGAGFVRLPDDGRRFFADPFLFEYRGETFLFVEEFPYATQRGIISLARLGPDGSPTTPVPIMEGREHLSYPFVFEADGVIYMIPETSARRRVELWRADPFPDRWTLDRVLIEDVDLADVTLLRKADGWWLFAAERARWASSWDTLVLYHAGTLAGPWQPHPANPVLVDRCSARPGGRILDLGGRLVRPAQDCSGGYGARLAFAAITRLDEEDFAQTVVSVAAPLGRNTGLHSYDRTGAFEAIDLFGPR